MQNIYRETFEQIHASEQLRKEVANVPKQEKAALRHRISKAGLIAAALALALAGTVLGGGDRQLDDGIPIPGDRRPDPKSGGERYQRGRDRHCGQYHRGQQSDLGIAGRDGLGL